MRYGIYDKKTHLILEAKPATNPPAATDYTKQNYDAKG